MYVERFVLASEHLQSIAMSINPTKYSDMHGKLKVGAMKKLYKYNTASTVNLGGGLPLESILPFEKLSMDLKDGNSYELAAGDKLFQNYTRGFGIPPMGTWIQAHMEKYHKPLYKYSSCVTGGSTDSLTKIYMLLKGDTVMFDEYSYPQAISGADIFGKIPVGVKSDQYGMIPDELRKTVLNLRSVGKSADIMYTIPTGHNPCGYTVPFERKLEIYAICHELDIIIVEDDAYYYLSYDKEGEDLPGLDALPRSYLSIDSDGRVLRLDSVSKFIAPGMRLGWICGPQDFIDKYLLIQEYSLQFPSTYSQSIFMGLINKWGVEGLDNHVKQIQLHYLRQRDVFVAALRNYFDESECSFVVPTSGMFLWLEFHLLKAASTAVLENNAATSSFQLFKLLAASDVIGVPGVEFYVPKVEEYMAVINEDGDHTAAASWSDRVPKVDNVTVMRFTYAAASPADMLRAVRCMSSSLRNAGWLNPSKVDAISSVEPSSSLIA